MLYEVTLVDGVCQVNLSNFCSNHNVRLPELTEFLSNNFQNKEVVNLVTKEGWNVIGRLDVSLICTELMDIYICLINGISYNEQYHKLMKQVIGDLHYDFEILRSAYMRGASVMASSL